MNKKEFLDLGTQALRKMNTPEANERFLVFQPNVIKEAVKKGVMEKRGKHIVYGGIKVVDQLTGKYAMSKDYEDGENNENS